MLLKQPTLERTINSLKEGGATVEQISIVIDVLTIIADIVLIAVILRRWKK